MLPCDANVRRCAVWPIDIGFTRAYGDGVKRSIEERGPIAAWLIRSRDRFSEPRSDHTWTVEEFLPALHAATGWSPARTTYARWESGAVRPSPKNLRRIEEFYAGRGVSGIEAPKPVPSVDPVVAAIDRQTMAIERLATQIAALLESRDRDLAALALTVGQALRGHVDLDRTPAS